MIVVTAPTSKIGRRVLDRLLAAEQPVRVVVRDPGRLSSATRERVDLVVGSHQDPAVIDQALIGADALFWLMPADPGAADAMAAYVEASRPAVRSVSDHGVQHVVGVSALGRGSTDADRAGNVTGSLAMDDLFASVTNYRSLANATFMDNTLRDVGSILHDGYISGPLDPDRAAPLVATGDIGEIGSQLMLDRDWSGFAEVPLLGPQDLSGTQMAAIIGEVLQRPVLYRQVTPDSIEESMRRIGISAGMARALADMAAAKARGLDEHVSRAVAARTPTTFSRWCSDVLKPAVEARSEGQGQSSDPAQKNTSIEGHI